MTDIFSLKNKVILITGAGKGIGNYLADKLSQEKAIIYAIDISFSNPNKILPTNLNQIKCDITSKKKFLEQYRNSTVISMLVLCINYVLKIF